MRTSSRFALAALALSSLLALTSACDDGDALAPDMAFPDAGPPVGRDMRTEAGPPDMMPLATEPDIDISPGQINLIAAVGAESTPGMLLISNQGQMPLEIRAVRFADDGGPFRVEVDGAPFEPRVLEPDQALSLQVIFAPEAAGDRQATLIIESNDPDELRREIPITGRNPEACIRAMPSSVNLGSVAVGGESARFRVQIVNCGDVTATIGPITLDGAEGFAWEVAQGMGPGQTLQPGNLLILELWYANAGLGADDTASAALTVQNDIQGELRININVRGGGGPTCELAIEPAMVDFETLRIGLTRQIPVTVINRGTAHCELRDQLVMATDGPEENSFAIERGLVGDRLEGGAEQTIEVVYRPVVADPIGDRAELRVTYHDPHRVQNRTASTLLRGVGAQALIGADPEAVQTGVTTVGCASWQRSVDVGNVGFVPICVTGFRYEGAGCAQFTPVSEPSVPDADCISLERGEVVVFTFQHQPAGVGDESCTLVIESDAQNTEALAVPLDGVGTDTAETVDEAIVGDLNGRRDAYFPLSRPCVEATLRLFVNDEETENFGFSAQRNALVFRANRHPAGEDDRIRMEYDAACLELGD